MRCTHFQIHFAMIATRERTHLHCASFTSLLQKILFVILEQMQQAKVQTLVLNNLQIVQKSKSARHSAELFVRWHRN